MFAVATLCPAQDVKPTDLGKGAAFNGKKIEMKDKGEVAYLLSFTAGKEFEATTDGPKNTDVHLFVYDSSGAIRRFVGYYFALAHQEAGS
jgi:hypothetical protein